MILRRQIDGQVYNLGYDAENHMVSVSGLATASFVYNGDGARVVATVRRCDHRFHRGMEVWDGGDGVPVYGAVQ